jgi:hypothetical protein
MTMKTAKELEAYVLEIPKGRKEKRAAHLRVMSMARVFGALTGPQITALQRIEAGWRLGLDGLPAARMRYDDAPRASRAADWTEAQIDLYYDYNRWCEITGETTIKKAVMALIQEDKMADVDARLNLSRGQSGMAVRFIADGLEVYVVMKGWGERTKDSPSPESRMRAMGEVPTRLLPDGAEKS